MPFELENLTLSQKYNEYMMMALRKSEGFSTQYIQDVFGAQYLEQVKAILPKYEKLKQLIPTKDGYTLTKEAKFFADGITSDFFWIP